MAGRIDFGASVEADACCFCRKPLVNLQTLTVQTTEGEALVLQYHETCFQEWLGNRGHISPASSVTNPPFIR